MGIILNHLSLRRNQVTSIRGIIMPLHLHKEMERLKKQTLELGIQVEENFARSVRSLRDKDKALAERVIEFDTVIDDMEVEVEEECLKILALHQPVARDLRFIITALKINNDLERIGDLAVNIAERSLYLADQPEVPIEFDFDTMAILTQNMMKKCLDALVNFDDELALKVCAQDDEVDAMNAQMYNLTKKAISEHPEHIDSLIHLLSACRHLERVADHSTNIAEDVYYMVKGRIIRHNTENY